MKKIFDNITVTMYLIVSITLIVFSIIIIVYSIYDLFNNLFFNVNNLGEDNNIILIVLQASGAIIISAAIVDVAKYMYEEEVMENKEIKKAKEARETLTKIIVIISIAVAIEGLIYIFKAGVEDIRLLIYPSILIISSTSMVVGLGIYHKLTIEPNKFNNHK